jgi:DNA invertase Pin-like site-specific DNA recombinase
MVDRGEIPRGRVLMVEDFDRLSRETVVDALAQFMALIQAGIIIAMSIDRQIYSRETIGNDRTQLILSLTRMAQAQEESAMKSKRLSAAWEKKRPEATIKPITARCPDWLRLEEWRIQKDQRAGRDRPPHL